MAGDQYNQTFYFCNFFVINSTFIQTSTVFILWFIYGIMKSMLLGTLNKAMGIKKVTDETGNSTAPNGNSTAGTNSTTGGNSSSTTGTTDGGMNGSNSTA